MSQSEKNPNCMACKNIVAIHEKKASGNWLDEFGGTVFSGINYRPSTKFHFNIITKRHADALKDLTVQEWNDILPVLKDGIKKTDKN